MDHCKVIFAPGMSFGIRMLGNDVKPHCQFFCVVMETAFFTVLPDCLMLEKYYSGIKCIKVIAVFVAVECWTAVVICSIQAGLILLHGYILEHKIPIENNVFPGG